MTDWIGYKWLAVTYGIELVQRLRTESLVAKSRTTESVDGYVRETYTAAVRPRDTVAGHLTFALKHEGVHLEFLARLFAVLPKAELEAWVRAEPTGLYAHRAGFFYEWLTHDTLDFDGVTGGAYVNALDEQRHFTSAQSRNITRWRVRDNLPGTRDYCPMVSYSPGVKQAAALDISACIQALETEFGEELLMRSAVWLTNKESRASFAIERETKWVDRIKRFAAVMASRCGHYSSPLDDAATVDLQKEILGPRATRYGMRQSPVFVGESDRYTQVVHYIAPHWDHVPEMLRGLRAFDARTKGLASVVRAAVLSFGFVYIHPMVDGNGRLSRFLINDTLRRDGVLPDPFILPVSATIISSSASRRGYDQVLELFSKPLMMRYADQYRFGDEVQGADAITYNLEFDGYADASFAWRYPDLTDHVEYLGAVIEDTLRKEMPKEANFLRQLRSAREAVKSLIEGPDVDIDRMIRSVRESGVVSNTLKREFNVLADEVLADQVARVIADAFDGA